MVASIRHQSRWTGTAALLRTIAIGYAGGVLFSVLGLPLPWVLGAMAATIMAGAVGVVGRMPRTTRNAVIPILGVTFGSAFDHGIVELLSGLWLLVVLTAIYLVATIGSGYVYFRRFAGLRPATAYFASVPGSFSEMLFVAEDMKADLRAVAVVHSMRLVISLTAITFGFRFTFGIDTSSAVEVSGGALSAQEVLILALCGIFGYFGGRAVRLPSAQLFGPLILSAAAHLSGLTDAAPPGWFVSFGQVFIGIFIGVRFAGVRFSEVRRLLFASCIWTAFLLCIALAAAEAAASIIGLPFIAGLLAFAPGGAVEISVVALAAGIDLSLVTATQLIRITLTVLCAPMVLRFLMKKLPD